MGFLRDISVLVFISLIAKGYADSKVECYSSASYQATKGEHSCKLSQPNWAAETYFELTHKHCLSDPKVNVFMRNFHGVDEINIDFNKKFSKWKGQSFTGKTYQIILKFTDIDSGKIQVKFIYVPVYRKIETQQLLTAIFRTDDKSDCIWAETLEIHDQVFLGIGLCGGFALIAGIAFVFRKYKMRPRHQAIRVADKVPL